MAGKNAKGTGRSSAGAAGPAFGAAGTAETNAREQGNYPGVAAGLAAGAEGTAETNAREQGNYPGVAAGLAAGAEGKDAGPRQVRAPEELRGEGRSAAEQVHAAESPREVAIRLARLGGRSDPGPDDVPGQPQGGADSVDLADAQGGLRRPAGPGVGRSLDAGGCREHGSDGGKLDHRFCPLRR
jgi:hypothetical protein